MRDAFRLECLDNAVIGLGKHSHGQSRVLRLNLGQDLQGPGARRAVVVAAENP